MALGGCLGCLRFMVIFFNLLFWLAGLGILAVSIWIRVDPTVKSYIEGQKDLESFYIGTYFLMASGALMTLVAFLGCCGAFRQSQCMLATFFIFLVIIFAAEITGAIWAFMRKEEVPAMITASLSETVMDEYEKNVPKTLYLNWLQETLHCCGARGPTDYGAGILNNYSCKSIGIEGCKKFNVPKSCCLKPDNVKCDIDRISATPLYAIGIHERGCSEALILLIKSNMGIIIGIGIGVAVIQILGMVFSLILCCALRRSNMYTKA